MFRSSRLFSSMALALPLFLVSELQAQEPIDIGLFQEGQMLEVRVRPNADFDGIFSAVVFTVRWDGSTGATLGDIVQEGAAATYIPTKVSGGVHEVGNMKYQVYAGFGFESEVIMRFSQKNLPIEEVPVGVFYPPETVRQTHYRNVPDTTRIVLRVVTTLLTHPKLSSRMKRNFFS